MEEPHQQPPSTEAQGGGATASQPDTVAEPSLNPAAEQQDYNSDSSSVAPPYS